MCMKWSTQERSQPASPAKRGEWYPWFAWYPVKVGNVWIWGKKIFRKKEIFYYGPINAVKEDIYWEYSLDLPGGFELDAGQSVGRWKRMLDKARKKFMNCKKCGAKEDVPLWCANCVNETLLKQKQEMVKENAPLLCANIVNEALMNQRREIVKEIEDKRKRYKCAACDRVKYGHTHCCEALTDIIKRMENV